MCKVSIVVPSKNMEKFIGKCLESLVSQTLKDIEIICVDAFSTDRTREIIQNYMNKDSRIMLLDDDVGSSGYADNLGFETAKGDYVAIVESDDYIEENMMETLYDKAIKNDLDYIKADFSMFIEIDGYSMSLDHIQPLNKLNIIDKVIKPSDYPELLELDGYMWKGIYKKLFIQSCDVKLNETKGAAYQDNGFLHQTICQARRVMYLGDCFYHYRRDNENSSDYNPNGLKMMLEEYKFVEMFMENNFTEVEDFYYYYYYKMFHQFRGQFEKVVRFGKYNSDIKEIVREYKLLMKAGIDGGYIRQDEFGGELQEFYLFYEDEDEIYFDYLKQIYKVQDKIYSDFLDRTREKEQVVLVCCGDKGRNLYCLLRKNDCNNVIAVSDNQKEKRGTTFFDKTISSVESVCFAYKNAYFIIANDLYHNQIKRQLLELGINKKNIEIFNLPIFPHLSTSRIIQCRG